MLKLGHHACCWFALPLALLLSLPHATAFFTTHAGSHRRSQQRSSLDVKNTSTEGPLVQDAPDVRLDQVGTLLPVATTDQLIFMLHAFDVTYLLSSQSSLWGREALTWKDLIKDSLGFSSLRFDFKNQFIKQEHLALYWSSNIGNGLRPLEPGTFDEWKQKLDTGPFKGGDGAVIYFHIFPDGVQLVMDGTDMGKVESSNLSRAVLLTYLDEAASNPKFREVIISKLQQGLPSNGSLSVEFVKSPGFRISRGFLVAVAFLVLAVFGSIVFCCFRACKA